MVDQPPRAKSLRFGADVRIAAIRDGALVSSTQGCFRFNAPSADCLIFDVLPGIATCDAEREATNGSGESWRHTLLPQLQAADIITCEPSSSDAISATPRLGFHVMRSTPLTEQVEPALARLGLAATTRAHDDAFVIADLSGLTARDAVAVIREVLLTRAPSITIWKSGATTFWGPIVDPGRTACWNCCRLRLADSGFGDASESVDADPATARIVATNVLLGARYPHVAAYGCVLVEVGGSSSLHSILPMPWCQTCGGAAALKRSRDFGIAHSPHVPASLRVLADPLAGVVRKVMIFTGDGKQAPAFPSCCSVVVAPYQDERRARPGFTGEGKGATVQDAVMSAIGEGVERYAAAIWNESAIVRASLDELAGQAFDPRGLVLYDAAQYRATDFPFAAFDAARPIDWTPGKWLDSNAPVYLPALATYLNFPAIADEQFAQTTSNGLAAGASFDDAAVRALYELIERDAFMLYWLARRSAVRVSQDGCEAVTARALEEVGRLGAATELYLIDSGTGYPTCVCLGLGNGRDWPGVTIGLGTHADPDVALRRAVLEHSHYGAYIRRLMREQRHLHVMTPEDVASSLDHALFYIHPDTASALDFFRAARDRPVSLIQLRQRYRHDTSLATCVVSLARAGIRAAAVDVTPPDIALAPLRVVRAFGTYMQPIHFGMGRQRPANPRLGRRYEAIETMPHPIA
jgi:ribosomal protein S12 methylthiotransferase accessory factor